ncbi:hypothetical protein EOD41_03935 [Mucilaginibacter limnophilus]|uniref:Fibrobacter succinogenes major paralogous domain-containing protein n=1 Tax=Mucilaginibacter limnophilus TaxID=1932778 RepID=A0A437MZK8_9SPHI|nr:FISUMP domain-containing protein [Mucilaginibacter limnophilus]RVU03093.1 hypothetical protein EOD41_03935 [Mucilaginibacter limnophilus]
MKNVFFTWVCTISCIFLLGSCSKSELSSNTEQKPEPVPAERVEGSVLIGDEVYPTITIGNREWTTENYHGEGGVMVPVIVVPPEQDTLVYGKLYTEEEAKAITLPAGWRLPNTNDFVQLLRREMSDYKRGSTIPPEIAARYMAKHRWQFTTDGNNLTGFKAVAAGRYTENALVDTIHYGMGTTAAYLIIDTSTVENEYKRAILIEKTDEGSTIKMRDIMPVNLYRNGELYNVNDRYTLRFVRDKVKE